MYLTEYRNNCVTLFNNDMEEISGISMQYKNFIYKKVI